MKNIAKNIGNNGIRNTGLLLAVLGVGLTGAAAQSASAPVPLEAQNVNIFADLSRKVMPSVVNISCVSKMKLGYDQSGEGLIDPRDLFGDFFGHSQRAPRNRRPEKSMAQGSGFVIDPSGIILTNNHVVAGADEIKIQFTEDSDEEPVSGTVIGRDVDLDVALIQVHTKRKLTALPLGNSDSLSVGDYVIAVGNPYGQGHSVSHGIISAKGRIAPGLPIANYLQTDAPINPGNSGGPLVNLKGEVVGINNAIDPRAQGIGFAIPIAFVERVLPQLKSKGKVSRGYIGAVVGQLTPEIAMKMGERKDLRAPLVTEVQAGSPAALAGLQPYDVILEVDGTSVHSPAEVVMAVTSVPLGKTVPVKISRAGQARTLSMKPRAKPEADSVALSDEDDGSGKKKDPKMTDIPTGMSIAANPASPGKGVVVTGVEEGSPAERSGIAEGDVILEIDRKPVRDMKTFNLALHEKGKSYLMRVEKTDGSGANFYSVVVLDLNVAKDSSSG